MTSDPTTADPLDSSLDEESTLPRMSFLEHLEELRRRILISVVAVIVAFAVCWSFAPEIFEWLQAPIKPLLKGETLAYTRLAAPFFLYMKAAFLAGLFLASPVILWQLWRFIAPGLYRRERLYAAPFIIFSTLFFVAGGYFGHRVVLPMAAAFFLELGENFQQVITIDDYFAVASKLILGMGLVFEMPTLIFFLARLGIVTPKFLLKKFKYAVLIIFIIAAIITPTPDPVTQSALAVPMILLYLLGVGIAMLFGKKEVGSRK
ncbi:MAG TPA: twin-arginine translocase subunit TatC [Thermoanaerobaculia bacterium]|nr:twin-arginine translocase subunit TatC [Thermoanaerobaculia bacterium]